MSSSLASLRELDNVYDRARLHRQVDKRPLVIVEGPSDERVIRRLLGNTVQPFVASTRSNVISVARQFNGSPVPRVACIIDRDFDQTVTKLLREIRCLVAWDGADLEQMLIDSPAWNYLLDEIGSREKILDAGGHEAARDLVMTTSRHLSRVRTSNELNRWALDFDQVDATSKISLSDLSLNLQGLVSSLARTSEQHPGIKSMLDVISTTVLLTCSSTGVALVSGKDTCTVLSIAFRRVLGSKRRKGDCDPSVLVSALRLSVDVEWFRKSDWFVELCQILEISPRESSSS